MPWILLFLFFVEQCKSDSINFVMRKIRNESLIAGACGKRGKTLSVFIYKNDWRFLPTETELCSRTCKIVDSQDSSDIILWHVDSQKEPRNLKNTQTLIAFGLEPSINSFSNPRVNFTSSFRFDSDIVYPYLGNRLYNAFESEEVPDEKTFNHMKLAVFINSHCVDFRDQFVKNLMKYINIDSRGECLNNAPRIPGSSPETIRRIKNQYKFYIAIENTYQQYYFSEKVFVGYLTNSIPVYYGAPEAKVFVPNESLIIIESLDVYEEIAQRILKISTNYTMWKDMYESRRKNFPHKNEIIDWVSKSRHCSDTMANGNLCKFCDHVCYNN